MQEGSVNEYLTFRKMITPVIIQILFWIGAGIAVIMSLITLVAGIAGGQALGAITGLIFLFLGPLLVRIYCELLIIMFRIYDTLTEIKKNTAPQGAAQPKEG